MLSINRVAQILLRRRFLIACCVAFCLAGVIAISLILPPIWVAHAQVMLNTVKPDPVTGEMTAGTGGALAAYESTQIALMTDYSVTGQVVDDLGLQTDPNFIQTYQNRSAKDQRDFRTFAADTIAKNIKVLPVKDSSILDIAYSSNSAGSATSIANEILKAYIKTALAFRTQSAEQSAQFYETELAKLKAKLDDAVAAETTYERANGLAMAGDKLDVDSARLEALANSPAPLVLPPPLADSSKSSELELSAVNAQIASASKTLGPNNPQMQELMRRKSGLEALVAKDEAAVRAANGAAANGGGHTDRELALQKSRVIANSDKIGHLETLQQDVEQRRNDYQSAALKFATFRAQADQTSSGTFTPLPAHTPDSPFFPNWLLEIPGALILGFMIGALTAVLIELFNRRVRVVEDLQQEFDEPVIGVIPAAARPSARPRKGPAGGLRRADTTPRAARA